MKTLTLHIEEPIYRIFKETAERRGVSAAELVRDAMRRYVQGGFETGPSLVDLQASELKPKYRALDLSDLAGEMYDDRP